MTRRYTHLITVSILATAFRAPISAQPATDAEAQCNLGVR